MLQGFFRSEISGAPLRRLPWLKLEKYILERFRAILRYLMILFIRLGKTA
jgi:hypothetical protein